MTLVVILLAAAFTLAGCRSTSRARDAKFSGFLSNYEQLTRNEGEGTFYAYVNPKADFRKYDKILFEPVALMAGPDSKLGKAPREDVQALVNYMAAKTAEVFTKDYALVKEPGPTTLRVRCALTDVGSKRVAMSTLSSITPIGLALQSIEMLASGTTLAAGEAAIEGEVLDSVTGERLAAAVDRRVGTMMPDKRHFDKWNHVKDALDYWIERLATRLRALRDVKGAPPAP
jgi:hypothetical protein